MDLIRTSSTVTLNSDPAYTPPQTPPTKKRPHTNYHHNHHETSPTTPQTSTTSPYTSHHQQQSPTNTTSTTNNNNNNNNTPRLHLHPSLLPSIITTSLHHLQKSHQALEPSPQSTTTPFYALELPAITFFDYAQRLVRYSYCPPAGILVALHYIDKLVKTSKVQVTQHTFHRVLLTALVISAKCCTDFFLSNAFYAKVGGVCTRELNVLEKEMLELLDWNVFVGEEKYGQIETDIVQIVRKFGGGELRNVMGLVGFEMKKTRDNVMGSPCSSGKCSPVSSPGKNNGGGERQ